MLKDLFADMFRPARVEDAILAWTLIFVFVAVAVLVVLGVTDMTGLTNVFAESSSSDSSTCVFVGKVLVCS